MTEPTVNTWLLDNGSSMTGVPGPSIGKGCGGFMLVDDDQVGADDCSDWPLGESFGDVFDHD